MEYNTLGQMTKVVFVDMNPNDQGFTKTFAYNANGKVSRTVNLNTNYAFYNPQTEDFEWNGDNITKKTYSSIMSPTPDVTEYLSYDDKLDPFNLGDVFPMIINGAPVSKNNYLTYKWTTTVTNYYERVFSYSANGYPSSVYTKQSPTSGTKFYYNK